MLARFPEVRFWFKNPIGNCDGILKCISCKRPLSRSVLVMNGNRDDKLSADGISHRNKNGESWVHLLYGEDEHRSSTITNLRRKLDVALTSKRSHERGDLLPYLVASDFVKFYESLTELSERATFFALMAEKLGVNFSEVLSKLSKLDDVLQNEERLKYRYQQNLVNSLTPPYKHLFDDISKLQFGISFLVNMRKDLLACFRTKQLSKTPALQGFDVCLKEHLAKWFANGFLDLEEISWNHSSGEKLEKVMQYEAVHAMKGWEDLKSRASIGRRIFTFSHRLMPGEPLVILHTLLGNEIPSNIQTVLNLKDPTLNVTTATFYSVSSTQRGLDGIGLGNLLIKRVVEKLKHEFSNMSIFVTLSPIPGFRKWLDPQLSIFKNSGEVPSSLQNIHGGEEVLIQLENLTSMKNWHEISEIDENLKKALIQLCARYLLHTKRRGFATDPVAHFHLRNGACLWRINWMGNRENYGFKASYGLMVNYRYELDHLEENNNNYVQFGKISVSENVNEYLAD